MEKRGKGGKVTHLGYVGKPLKGIPGHQQSPVGKDTLVFRHWYRPVLANVRQMLRLEHGTMDRVNKCSGTSRGRGQVESKGP